MVVAGLLEWVEVGAYLASATAFAGATIDSRRGRFRGRHGTFRWHLIVSSYNVLLQRIIAFDSRQREVSSG